MEHNLVFAVTIPSSHTQSSLASCQPQHAASTCRQKPAFTVLISSGYISVIFRCLSCVSQRLSSLFPNYYNCCIVHGASVQCIFSSCLCRHFLGHSSFFDKMATVLWKGRSSLWLSLLTPISSMHSGHLTVKSVLGSKYKPREIPPRDQRGDMKDFVVPIAAAHRTGNRAGDYNL